MTKENGPSAHDRVARRLAEEQRYFWNVFFIGREVFRRARFATHGMRTDQMSKMSIFILFCY
jgi:hypothetical protein